jgi:hypothetical protein
MAKKALQPKEANKQQLAAFRKAARELGARMKTRIGLRKRCERWRSKNQKP